jgi:hypothetical protein
MARGALVVVIYPFYLGVRNKRQSGQMSVCEIVIAAGGLCRGVEDGFSLQASPFSVFRFDLGLSLLVGMLVLFSWSRAYCWSAAMD